MTNPLKKFVNDVRNNAGSRKKTNTADSKDSSRSDDAPKEEEKKPEVEAKGPPNPPDSSKIQGSSLYGLVLPDEHSNKTLYLRDASGVEIQAGLRKIPLPPATRAEIALPRRGDGSTKPISAGVQSGQTSSAGKSPKLTQSDACKVIKLPLRCGICDKGKRIKDLELTAGCHHCFCHECIKVYATSKVRDKAQRAIFVDVRCPVEGCEENWQPKILRNFLDDEVRKIWEINHEFWNSEDAQVAGSGESSNVLSEKDAEESRKVVGVLLRCATDLDKKFDAKNPTGHQDDYQQYGDEETQRKIKLALERNRFGSSSSQSGGGAPSTQRSPDQKDDEQKTVAEQLTGEQMSEFAEVFSIVDKDKDGFISAEELRTVMRSIGQNPTEAELQDIFNKLDADQNGKIDEAEFLKWMERVMKITLNVEQLFVRDLEEFDKDQTGFISTDNFRRVVTSYLGDQMTDEDFVGMMISVDPKSTGQINYKEYVKKMFGRR
ncbi:OLC1v1017770C1 [Oldenlandia corymbosa var. corymbosa]|uniref:OLC1v1017770C1 n=1 Tax=Oldenlandia corymbosa var. corymbosa TaxID=529605 RepID=A0AAV1EA47_OLDCO|nr:OLC1v1017770C1 [Oldenlandia corymbosa var. corymbosa]